MRIDKMTAKHPKFVCKKITEQTTKSSAKHRVKPVSLLTLLPASRKALGFALEGIRRTLGSLRDQGLSYWELCIGVNQQHIKLVTCFLNEFERTDFDEKGRGRVRLVVLNEKSFADHLLVLVKQARGDWVTFTFAGDCYAPHFVYECLKLTLNRPAVELFYFDDDWYQIKKRPTGQIKRHTPQFKPVFSWDLLLSQDYLGLSWVTKKSILVGVIKSSVNIGLNFGYALSLSAVHRVLNKNVDKNRLSEDFPIESIPAVLRHRDESSEQAIKHERSTESTRSRKKFVTSVLIASGQRPTLKVKNDGLLGIQWPLPRARPLVSIIIPTRDQFTILKKCIDSLLRKTKYLNYEVIVMDNQTVELSALKYLDNLSKRHQNVKVHLYDKPFNYAAINNAAARLAMGELLLLMNNDVEVVDGGWLEHMVRHALRDDVGCVGAKLLFPDRSIQHAGVAIGMHGVADHMFRAIRPSKRNDPYRQLETVRNPLAVTAAVMAVRRELFFELGGLDEKKFKVAFNDVDLCLKAESLGYRTLWIPDACLIHHESKTRAPRSVASDSETEDERQKRAMSLEREKTEVSAMHARWGKLLRNQSKRLSARHAPLQAL